MGAVNERHKDRYPKFRVGGALNASTYRGEPGDAPQAKTCRCETPWLEVQEDRTYHCIGCGRDWRVRPT